MLGKGLWGLKWAWSWVPCASCLKASSPGAGLGGGLGAVSGQPGPTWATEAHRTRPTTPHPEPSPCFPSPMPESQNSIRKDRMPRLPLGAPARAGVPRFMKEGLGQIPGQVWLTLGSTSCLQSTLGCVHSPPSRTPLLSGGGSPHRKAGEPEIRAGAGAGPGALGCWRFIYSPDPGPGMASHSPPEGSRHVPPELRGGNCGHHTKPTLWCPVAPCPASWAAPTLSSSDRTAPSLPPHLPQPKQDWSSKAWLRPPDPDLSPALLCPEHPCKAGRDLAPPQTTVDGPRSLPGGCVLLLASASESPNSEADMRKSAAWAGGAGGQGNRDGAPAVATRSQGSRADVVCPPQSVGLLALDVCLPGSLAPHSAPGAGRSVSRSQPPHPVPQLPALSQRPT